MNTTPDDTPDADTDTDDWDIESLHSAPRLYGAGPLEELEPGSEVVVTYTDRETGVHRSERLVWSSPI